MRKWTRRFCRWLAALVALSIVALVALLESAEVETMASGVDHRLLIPVPGAGTIAIPLYAAGGRDVRIAGFMDGPVVRMGQDGRWQARWFCEDRVEHREGRGHTLSATCAGQRLDLRLDHPRIPADDMPMPDTVTVISDIEGDDNFLARSLQRLGIVGRTGRWIHRNGHLVVLGDSVDRGRDATRVLWRLHQLSLQAQAAGGDVHVLLGNHEQYALRGNLSRAHPEHVHALQQLGGYAESYSPETLLGRWLRTQPVALRMGRTLFVHGGVSPQVVARGGTVASLNATMRSYWEGRDPVHAGDRLESVLGFQGVTQYRGNVMSLEGEYARDTAEQVRQALLHFNVDTIVVAHTQVPRITFEYDGGVIAVNTGGEGAEAQVLQFNQGRAVVWNTGVARNETHSSGMRFKAFSPWRTDDRRLLHHAYRQMRRMARLPHPY